MASVSWSAEDRAYLETLIDRRDWIGDAVQRFPNRSEAAVRCMMQKIRAEAGYNDKRFVDMAWMSDAVNGSRRLLERLNACGLRPA